MSETNIIEKEHHIQQEFCRTRPAYRQGRNLTAVKVTVHVPELCIEKLYVCFFIGLHG